MNTRETENEKQMKSLIYGLSHFQGKNCVERLLEFPQLELRGAQICCFVHKRDRVWSFCVCVCERVFCQNHTPGAFGLFLAVSCWEDRIKLTFRAILAASASERLSKLTNPTGCRKQRNQGKRKSSSNCSKQPFLFGYKDDWVKKSTWNDIQSTF